MATVGDQLNQPEMIDTADIDEPGCMLHSLLVKNNDVRKMQVGEYMSCNYSYENGFSNFDIGSDLSFVCVHKTRKKRVLVSNKVFPNLSFDEVNKKGFIYGKVLDNQPVENAISEIRSLSGGTGNGVASEYDDYIVNSNLNGLIEPGDKNIWNWDVGTITNSTYLLDTNKTVARGGANVDTYKCTDKIESKNITCGFRPVLELTTPFITPLFNIDRKTRVYDDKLLLVDINLDPSISENEAKVRADVYNISTGMSVCSSDFSSVVNNSAITECVFDSSKFKMNETNTLKVTVYDQNGYSSLSYFKVFAVNDKFIVVNNISETIPIINHNNKDRLLISIESKKQPVVVHNAEGSFNLIENEEYAKSNYKNTFIIFHDEDITAYGVCFC